MNINQVEDIKLNFILATARTGSTLLSSMLNMHPNVISPHEEPFAYTLHQKYGKIDQWTSGTIENYCDDFYFFSRGKLDQFGTKEDLRIILKKYKSYLTFDVVIRLTYLCFFPDKNKTAVNTIVDKQLEFHACLENVADIYPKSKFLILLRDPRDQVLSRFLLAKRRKEREENYLSRAYIWNHKYKTLAEKASKIGKDRFLEIKYEDLILNPEKKLRDICLFFNLPYNPVMLEYDEHYRKLGDKNIDEIAKQNFLSVHSGLVQKVDDKKIGVWKKEMKQEDINLIWTVCGELAEQFGYKREEHFVKQKLTIKDYFSLINFFILNIIAPKIYHSAPFYIKRFVNRILWPKSNTEKSK